jgi:hypothetical protein
MQERPEHPHGASGERKTERCHEHRVAPSRPPDRRSAPSRYPSPPQPDRRARTSRPRCRAPSAPSTGRGGRRCTPRRSAAGRHLGRAARSSRRTQRRRGSQRTVARRSWRRPERADRRQTGRQPRARADSRSRCPVMRSRDWPRTRAGNGLRDRSGWRAPRTPASARLGEPAEGSVPRLCGAPSTALALTGPRNIVAEGRTPRLGVNCARQRGSPRASCGISVWIGA